MKKFIIMYFWRARYDMFQVWRTRKPQVAGQVQVSTAHEIRLQSPQAGGVGSDGR